MELPFNLMNREESLYDKNLTCLYCGHKFKSKQVLSRKAIVSKKDEDMCHYYEGENSYFYDAFVCPNCGFAFTSSFKKLNKIAMEELEDKYLNKIEIPQNLGGPRDIKQAEKSYKLALLCGTITKQKDLALAQICLRIAWLNRYQENKEEENRFLENALKLYTKAYETENLDANPANRDLILYLIGELNGRLGNIEETRKWFSIIIGNRQSDKAILNLTRERWLDYKYEQAT